MDSMEFAAAMGWRNCVNDGKNYCGVYMGFPFVSSFLRGVKNGVTSFTLRIQFAMPPGNLFRELKIRLKGVVRLQKLSMGQNLFCVNVTINKGQPFEAAFDMLLYETTATAGRLMLGGPNTCPVCKQDRCDAYAYTGTAYQPVHAACVLRQSHDIRDKVNQNELTGSYFLGFLGALLGGIVGAIPTVLLVVFAGIISGWLCAVIPLGEYYGYKLFRGKLSRNVLKIIIVVSLILIPFTQYFVELLWSIKEGFGVLSVSDYVKFLVEYPGELVPNMLQYLLFIAIGFFLVFQIIRRNNVMIWQESSFSESTIRMMNQPQNGAYEQPVGSATVNTGFHGSEGSSQQ